MKTKYGWIEIDGVRYEHDVIILRDRSVVKRSKKKSRKLKNTYGHTPLSAKEIEFVEAEEPEVVYIGTGQYGDLPITDGAKAILKGFETVIRPTSELLELLEEENRPYVAFIHVTC
jgi:hypothetical protein